MFTGGVLVVDRASLRSQISLLLAKDSIVTVLLVRGAPKSGKTWGKWLFEAAGKEAGAKPIYVGQGIVFTLEDVIRELFAPVGGIPTQLAEMLANVQSKPTTPDAWFRLICNLLLEAREQGEHASCGSPSTISASTSRTSRSSTTRSSSSSSSSP